jgi:hypothetical protein
MAPGLQALPVGKENLRRGTASSLRRLLAEDNTLPAGLRVRVGAFHSARRRRTNICERRERRPLNGVPPRCGALKNCDNKPGLPTRSRARCRS